MAAHARNGTTTQPWRIKTTERIYRDQVFLDGLVHCGALDCPGRHDRGCRLSPDGSPTIRTPTASGYTQTQRWRSRHATRIPTAASTGARCQVHARLWGGTHRVDPAVIDPPAHIDRLEPDEMTDLHVRDPPLGDEPANVTTRHARGALPSQYPGAGRPTTTARSDPKRRTDWSARRTSWSEMVS